MKQYRFTESQFNNFLVEAVKSVLTEVSGWDLEEGDVTWVNDEESGDKPYMVRIWTGKGYYLDAFAAYAFSEEHALDEVVVWLEKNEPDNSWFADDEVASMREELESEGRDEEEIDEEIDQNYYYVDATMEGASKPHYIRLENLSIYPYDKSKFKK